MPSSRSGFPAFSLPLSAVQLRERLGQSGYDTRSVLLVLRATGHAVAGITERVRVRDSHEGTIVVLQMHQFAGVRLPANDAAGDFVNAHPNSVGGDHLDNVGLARLAPRLEGFVPSRHA